MNLQQSGITALFEEKLAFFQKIHACAEKQTTLLLAEQLNEYQSLMETRKSYMETVTKLDIVLKGHLADPVYRTLADQTNQQIREWIIRIMEVDQRNRELLQHEMSHTKQKLESIHHGKKGASGYQKCGMVPMMGAYTDSRK